MSPVARLIELSQRQHDRRDHIKREIMRTLDKMPLTEEQIRYDQNFIKMDGREG